MSDVPEAVRQAVYVRDGHQCIVATPECFGGLTLQHRVNRGMGGSDRLDTVENLLTMCAGHNTRLEADAPFAEVGRRLGWKLESWENPLEVAVFSAVGGWRLLTGDGKTVPCMARDAERRAVLKADPYAGWRS